MEKLVGLLFFPHLFYPTIICRLIGIISTWAVTALMKYLTLILAFFLCSCADLDSKNQSSQARSGSLGEFALGVLKSNNAASKCEQGHAEDRVNCRKRKQEQVDAITKSIKDHTVQ